MSFPDFIPIEYRGMSILTALFFFFTGVGSAFVIQSIKKDIATIDSKLNTTTSDFNFQKSRIAEEICRQNNEMSEMRTSIALLLQSTDRIEKYLEKCTKII